MFAARNIKLCTKDCACLMVCPTGATDTENGQIDESKCLDGCRLCVDACPSHAIYLVSTKTLARRKPEGEADASLEGALAALSELRHRAGTAAEGADVNARFLKALSHSSRVLAEDCWRERGFLTMDPALIGSFMGSPEVAAVFAAAGGSPEELRAAAAAITSAVSAGIDLAD